jgi:hypothetical protein
MNKTLHILLYKTIDGLQPADVHDIINRKTGIEYVFA